MDFLEAEGEIPVGFLHVEYQLFRKDLSTLMGKQPGEAPTKTAGSDRLAHQILYHKALRQNACVTDKQQNSAGQGMCTRNAMMWQWHHV